MKKEEYYLSGIVGGNQKEKDNLSGIIGGNIKEKDHLSGIIGGNIKGNENKILQEKMQSTINEIKAEINNKFTKEKNNLYIYYKYSVEKRIFNIFVVFTKNNNLFKNKEITYLIKVGEEFPKKPPKVFCLCEFNEKIDLFVMKNLQKNLIEQWKQNNTISDLIIELKSFFDAIMFQTENKLLPEVGEYYYNSYTYDINDFLLNKNNIFFRVYYFSNAENADDINNNERYMIITKSTILFFNSCNPNKKNNCVIEFKFELTWIESLKHFSLQKYPNYIFFKFEWNNHSNYMHKFVFGIKEGNDTVSKIKDIILDRKRYLLNNFKFFEKYSDNDVETLEKIINIKEKFLEMKHSKYLYHQINQLYRNIINIFNSMNDEGYKKYVDKLQQFISKYEKM
jgi:ubiquitin-protein ligase